MLPDMAFHHIAVAVSDLAETHRFYTEVMGFELVKATRPPPTRPVAGPSTSSTPPARSSRGSHLS